MNSIILFKRFIDMLTAHLMNLCRGSAAFIPFIRFIKKIKLRSLIIYKKNRVEKTSLVPIVLTRKLCEKNTYQKHMCKMSLSRSAVTII